MSSRPDEKTGHHHEETVMTRHRKRLPRPLVSTIIKGVVSGIVRALIDLLMPHEGL
ncbi:hypothetical protein [Amycolatopsis sp. CA-126428]|uniref:hypothetical protein n=1 Tax=Amycolatopsis sp. CA-126428 TaxID=2073158 RepID=UPI0013049DD9|nr:hypothetical protein [Amycolatopsis sp. CA-126428]